MKRNKLQLLRGAVLALGLVLSGPALAGELSPNNVNDPVLVRGGEAGGAWYPLPADGSLTFDVTGPLKLEVELIERLPDGENGQTTTVKAKGDGQVFLSLKVQGKAGTGMIMDADGGTASQVTRYEIDVPGGDHIFALEGTDPDVMLLARVIVEDEVAEPAVVEVTPDEEPTEEPVVEDEPPVEEEPVIAEEEPAVEEEPVIAEEEPAEEEPVDETPQPYQPEFSDPPASSSNSGPDTDGLQLGLRTGLGTTAAGNTASWYLGVEALVPAPFDNVQWGLRVGRYGANLDTQIAVQPAIGQSATAYDVAWKTRVRPVEAGARYSFAAGPVQAYGWAALASYWSTRIEDDERVRGLSLGTSWALGLDVPLGNGWLSPELAATLGRRDFGNPAETSETAREKISGTRVNVAYRIAF